MAGSLIWTTAGYAQTEALNQARKPPLHWLIDASSNASLLKFHVAPANCESFLHLIFDRIGGGRESVCATRHCFDDFRSKLTGGHAERYSQPRSSNAERSTPGGAYHPGER